MGEQLKNMPEDEKRDLIKKMKKQHAEIQKKALERKRFLEMRERLKAYGVRKFKVMTSFKSFTDSTQFCIVLTAPVSKGQANSMLAVDIRRVAKNNNSVLRRPVKKSIKYDVSRATATIRREKKSITRRSVSDIFGA